MFVLAMCSIEYVVLVSGLPQDPYEAICCYQRSSDVGHTEASIRLNILTKQYPLLAAIVSDENGYLFFYNL